MLNKIINTDISFSNRSKSTINPKRY